MDNQNQSNGKKLFGIVILWILIVTMVASLCIQALWFKGHPVVTYALVIGYVVFAFYLRKKGI